MISSNWSNWSSSTRGRVLVFLCLIATFGLNILAQEDLSLSLSGIILRTTLVFIGQNWSKTFHYLATFILLPNIAYVVTNVIASNIALSLGMIGALSIVRFRHPVRSNFELTIYFALLTLGIVP